MDTLVRVRVLPPCVVEMDERGMPWWFSQEWTSSRVSGCGATSSATCSLERCAPYLRRSGGVGEHMGDRRGIREGVLWMARVADLIKGVDQGSFSIGLKRNVKVNGITCWWVAHDLPVFRDGVPRVLRVNVVPTS